MKRGSSEILDRDQTSNIWPIDLPEQRSEAEELVDNKVPRAKRVVKGVK